MKVLFIVKRRYTNKDLILDRFGRLYHLPAGLAALGHEVEVWALEHRWGEPDAGIDEGRLQIRSLPLGPTALANLRARARHAKPDLIVASGHLHLAALAQAAATAWGCPWVYDLYDYYPAFMGAAAPLAAVLFRQQCLQADGCIVASEALVDWVRPWAQAVCRIENGYDPEVFNPVAPRSGCGEYTVGFAGSMSVRRGFSDAYDSIRLLNQKGIKVKLLAAGTVEGSLDLPAAPWFEYAGRLSQTEVVALLHTCNVALVPYRLTQELHFSNSCKLVEYLALGLPVVATRTGDHHRYLPADYPGWCEPGDAASMAEAIRRQLHSPRLLPPPWSFSWGSLSQRLESFLSVFIASGPRP